jgi:predicted esterase
MGVRRALIALVLALSAVVMAANSAAGTPHRYMDPVFSDLVADRGVVYGHAVDWRGKTIDLHLDLFQPAGDEATGRPAYLWAHGGSFAYGNRSMPGPVQDMARRGWVAASVDYRLHPGIELRLLAYLRTGSSEDYPDVVHAISDAQHDLQAAVRWMRANASRLRIDPNRIAVGGFSAGAIAASAVAVNSDDPGRSGNAGYRSDVSAAVGHASAGVPWVDLRIGPGEPPIALFHGTADRIVPFRSALMHCAAARSFLNVCELTPFAGRDHELLGTEAAALFLYRWVAPH